jgi:HSP20 family molecular chaperone IbpA
MNLKLFDYGLYQMYKNLGAFGMSYDVEEKEDQIIFTMGVPGMAEGDIDVRVKDGRRLVVRSLNKSKYVPDFCYSFVLPCKVIKKETYATVKNGVLSIFIKKAEPDEYKISLR